ncbi:hypothetical protein [Klebsiella grimontii]|uniref:hypothetical protein n=1 Tax=Klebsiella grimontii TaxID=2058152 RepID=UPI001911BE1C|nr:hypothetical protein [Klebsiella grimontii]
MKNEGKLSDGVKSLSIINKLQPEQKLTLLFDICCEFKLEISHWYQREVTKKTLFFFNIYLFDNGSHLNNNLHTNTYVTFFNEC